MKTYCHCSVVRPSNARYARCRTLPAAQFDSIIAAGTAEAALARESEARAQSEAASLRKEAITAWKQVEERQQALQALEVGLRFSPDIPALSCHACHCKQLRHLCRAVYKAAAFSLSLRELLTKQQIILVASAITNVCTSIVQTVQKAAVAENSRLRASLQEWSLANARLERQLQESLQPASAS